MEKNLFRKILFYLSVPRCVFCGDRLDIDDDGLCKSCLPRYNDLKLRNCSRCSLPLNACSCSNAFLENHYVKKHIKVFRYIRHHDDNVANNLIFSLKRENRDDVLSFLASEIETAIINTIGEDRDFTVTNVPRRKSAKVKYGIDHSKLLAKRVAKDLGLKYVSILKSKSRMPQKSLIGIDRIKNAEFDIKRTAEKGTRFILIDDIVTTGASLGSCAALLHAIGAKEIIGASLAVAYKDKYTPFAYVAPIK